MISPFFILFSLMGVGFLCKKFRWLDDIMNAGISNLLANVAMPALLFSSITELSMKGKLLADFFWMTVLSVAFLFLYALLAEVYRRICKFPGKYGGMIQLSMLSSNNGFMGFPVTLAFFGQAGLLLMIANNLAMTVVLFSYGVYVLKRTKNLEEGGELIAKRGVREALMQMLNINIIMVALGIFLSLTGMNSYIPEAVGDLLSMLGSLATPLSMIYIGATLYGIPFVQLFRDRMVLFVSVGRSTLLAGITFLLLWFLPLSPLMKQIALLVIALPSAAIIPVMVAQFGTGKVEATKIVVMSTLLSLLTAPLGVTLALQFFH